jgi:hypothetical protein
MVSTIARISGSFGSYRYKMMVRDVGSYIRFRVCVYVCVCFLLTEIQLQRAPHLFIAFSEAFSHSFLKISNISFTATSHLLVHNNQHLNSCAGSNKQCYLLLSCEFVVFFARVDNLV